MEEIKSLKIKTLLTFRQANLNGVLWIAEFTVGKVHV